MLECFESDAMCTNEMITKIGLGKEVSLLVECYSPKSPDAVVPLDDPIGAPPMVSLEVPPDLSILMT